MKIPLCRNKTFDLKLIKRIFKVFWKASLDSNILIKKTCVQESSYKKNFEMGEGYLLKDYK